MDILPYDDTVHRSQVIELWTWIFGYPADYNAPDKVIDAKIGHDKLFWVALDDGTVTGTIMAGYDGHRGWIYSMAVTPEYRNRGIGSGLLRHAESALVELGCKKLNLQIIAENRAVRDFYEANGFSVEERISMGKRIGE